MKKKDDLKNTNSLSGLPRRYDALDLLRGVAALVVCFYHLSWAFTPRHTLFKSGFLCVDLFFMLSGFVIAANYDNKIAQGLSFRRFFGDRMARLYPLFFFATLLGAARLLLQKYNTGGIFDGSHTFATLMINLGMLPSFFKTGWAVFPMNPPSWSIFFEVWVNILFFIIWRRLGNRFLAVLITSGALGLIASAGIYSKLDLGAGIDDFVPGFARVVFSFFLGVAIFRSKAAERWRLGVWAVVIVMVLLLVILNARAWLPIGWQSVSDLVIVSLIFPLFVIILAAARLPPVGCRIAAILGNSSYAVYLLQLPVMGFVTGIMSVLLGKKAMDYVPMLGIVFIPCFLGLCYLTYRFFELPAKNWMRGFLRGKSFKHFAWYDGSNAGIQVENRSIDAVSEPPPPTANP